MPQYKVRLKNQRIIGPLTEREIADLYLNGKISGSEDLQIFPNGDWKKIKNILENLDLESEIAELSPEETHIFNLKNLLKNDDKKIVSKSEIIDEPSNLEEFKYDKNEVEEIIEEPKKSEIFEIEQVGDENKTQVRMDVKEQDNDPDEEKTRLNLSYQQYLKNLEIEKEEEDKEKKKEEAEKLKREIKVDYENESTQILNLETKKDIDDEVILVEQELKNEKRSIDEEINEIEKKKLEKEKLKSAKNVQEEKKPKAKSKYVTILAVFLILYMVLDEDEKKVSKGLNPIVLVTPKIKFPTQFDEPDTDKSQKIYNLALLEEKKETHKDLVRANVLFRSALENDFKNVNIAARYIFTSSKLLENSNKYNYHANMIFKMVQIFKDKIYESPNMASAIAYFYYSIEKPKAALKVFDMYMTLNSKKATIELFTVRLLSLMAVGDLQNAKVTVKKLEEITDKNLFLIEALIEYYNLNQLTEEKVSLLERALAKYPKSVFLTLERAQLFLESSNLEEVKVLIKKLNRLNVEGSKKYYAQYLALKGVYYAISGNVKKAVLDLKKSLDIEESISLIEKIAILEEHEDEDINSIILLSKSKSSIIKAREFLKNENLEAAMKEIIEAVSIDSENLELRLFLAKLQMKRGYIKDAIDQLEELYKNNGSSGDVLYNLIDAYIEAHKYKRVLELLNIAQNLKTVNQDLFYSAKGKLSLYRGDFNAASGWLQRAIKANPLNDQNIFDLSKLFIKYHKYQKGKSILKRAMDLDPSNVEYNLYFAEILYETESSKAAIGYLYDILKDTPDNPKILSKIGIYFYRSGQIKKYDLIRKQLLKIPKKHKSLYEFLIESARLEDDLNKVIEYSELLLEIDPGDLSIRMKLARNYIKLQKYKLAKNELDLISTRLDTYPRLQYLYAKLYYFVDDIDKAKTLVKKEIKENPNVVDGYILLADILIKEKNYNEAKKQYLKAIQVDSRNIDAILGVAFIAFHSDQYDMALDQYQKVVDIDPNKSEVYKLLGDAYRKLGQSQLAVKNYKHFLELSPNTKYKNSINTYIRTMQ